MCKLEIQMVMHCNIATTSLFFLEALLTILFFFFGVLESTGALQSCTKRVKDVELSGMSSPLNENMCTRGLQNAERWYVGVCIL